jgi:hypothetical protein
MILIGFTSYPMQSSEQVMKRMIELPRLPEYIKGRGNYGYVTRDGGVEGIQIYEFDGSKAEEAYEAISEPYTKFADIPGYKMELRIAVKAREYVKKYMK